MSETPVVIVGAGPYGLSLAAHLEARGVEHRIFGRPMRFWEQVAEAAKERYLKSFCFATNLSSPKAGYTFAEYNRPRGLETFEPCSMGNFAEYGQWFAQNNVPWSESADVTNIESLGNGFRVTLTTEEPVLAGRVVIATGLSNFAYTPSVFSALPAEQAIHTSSVESFTPFKGRSVAVIGAGQSALEAAALLHEVGARPHLLIREDKVLWHSRVTQVRTPWQRLRSPISGLGVGPKAWALNNFPGALHRLPPGLRTRLTKGYLPPEGAWWLRSRVEGLVETDTGATVTQATSKGGKVTLQVRIERDGVEKQIRVDQVIAGSGYDISVERLSFIEPGLRGAISLLGRSPKLNFAFESSVSGLHFIGPTSTMSFGPLFRFVAGADYTARTLSSHLASRIRALRPSSALRAA